MSSPRVNDAMVGNHPSIDAFTPKTAKSDSVPQDKMCKGAGNDVTMDVEEVDSHTIRQTASAAPSPTTPSLFASNSPIATSASSNLEGTLTNDDNEPKKKQRTKQLNEDVTKEAQKIIDRFQSPKCLVEITIPSGKKFALHIGVLVEKCDYFRAALTGNFLETKTKQISLADVSDNTFDLFLKWLYDGLRHRYQDRRFDGVTRISRGRLALARCGDLRDVWDIEPEKYFVKEDKKDEWT